MEAPLAKAYLHMQVDVGVEDRHGGGLEEEDELDPDEVAAREVVQDPPHHGVRLVGGARQEPGRRGRRLHEVLPPPAVALCGGRQVKGLKCEVSQFSDSSHST